MREKTVQVQQMWLWEDTIILKALFVIKWLSLIEKLNGWWKWCSVLHDFTLYQYSLTDMSETHLNAFRSPSDLEAGCSFSSFTHPFTCHQKTKNWNSCIQQFIVNYRITFLKKFNSWQDQGNKRHWKFRGKSCYQHSTKPNQTGHSFAKHRITLDIKYKSVTKMIIWKQYIFFNGIYINLGKTDLGLQ